jgi:hypothetical protein
MTDPVVFTIRADQSCAAPFTQVTDSSLCNSFRMRTDIKGMGGVVTWYNNACVEIAANKTEPGHVCYTSPQQFDDFNAGVEADSAITSAEDRYLALTGGAQSQYNDVVAAATIQHDATIADANRQLEAINTIAEGSRAQASQYACSVLDDDACAYSTLCSSSAGACFLK